MEFNKITISGGVCTGKSTLNEGLNEKLGWPVLSSGKFFREYAKEHGLDIQTAEEQRPEITREVDNRVKETLRTKDNVIIDSWLGGYLAQGIPHVLKVLLKSDDEVRSLRFSLREHCSIEEAKKRIFEREQNVFTRLATIYDCDADDFFDPNLYNMVIDTSKLSVKETVIKVLDKLHE